MYARAITRTRVFHLQVQVSKCIDSLSEVQTQSMREAVKQLQEELQAKDEQLAAFKSKTKAYVESKNKQHTQALEVD